MNNKLSIQEMNFVKRLFKNQKIIHYGFIVAGFLGCISILGLIIAIRLHSRDGLMMAIYFGTLAFILIFKTRSDNITAQIIEKLLPNDQSSLE